MMMVVSENLVLVESIMGVGSGSGYSIFEYSAVNLSKFQC